MERNLTAIWGVTCHVGSPSTRHKWTYTDLPAPEGWKSEL